MKNEWIHFKYFFLVFFLVLDFGYLVSQNPDTTAQRKMQLGFVLGYTTMHYRLTPQIVDNGDGLTSIRQKPGWAGLHLGCPIKKYINSNLSFVATPSWMFGERNLIYTYNNTSNGAEIKKTYIIESIYLSVPFCMQIAPPFMRKQGIYSNIGITIMNDLNSINKKIVYADKNSSDELRPVIKQWDYAVIIGLGRKILDKKTKIYAEINFDYGLVNINAKKTELNDAIKRLKSNVVGMSFVIN